VGALRVGEDRGHQADGAARVVGESGAPVELPAPPPPSEHATALLGSGGSRRPRPKAGRTPTPFPSGTLVCSPSAVKSRLAPRSIADCTQGEQAPTIVAMERQAHHDDDMLSRVELAAALNISTRTVDRWIAEGTGPPYVRLPRGMLRWRWGDVQAWLAERREGG